MTESRIDKVLQNEDISPDTTMILISALYFKADWSKPFDLEQTRSDVFHLNDKSQVQVEMMSVSGHFRVADLPELKAKALEMPYKGKCLRRQVLQ